MSGMKISQLTASPIALLHGSDVFNRQMIMLRPSNHL
jgi:hypothetical protein